MSCANQRTLFQTWGTSAPKAPVPDKDVRKKASCRRKDCPNKNEKKNENATSRGCLWGEIGQGTAANQTKDEQEMDDDLMLVAVYEAEKSLENCDTDPKELRVPTHTYSDLPGYDSSSGRVWIYPTNFPIRDYQLKISEACLFQNTLVCLPTGLGKTFIASVVMYNFYRWYPSGKIVFMAPTKPLVAQQIEACYKVMGIPQHHMAELTGGTAAPQRGELWGAKRVFFLTPQVMVNDLSRNTCPASQVKCVVIDEAHKASGNHAYCQVVRQLWNHTKQFRVLALSATPGGDMKAVQQVITNLLISHIELRSEESPDIQAHSHQRSLEKIVVPLGEALMGYQTRYLQVLEKFTSRLTQMRVLYHRDLASLTKYQLIMARDQFRNNPPPHVTRAQHGVLQGDFALCISLYHGLELLQQMGLRSHFLFMQNIMMGAKEYSRARSELQRTPVFMDLYREMEAMFQTSTKGPEDQFFYSHPKLQKLDEVVLHHFRTWSENSGCALDSGDASRGESTRVMIFSSFRESVQEIAEMLNRHQPLIKVMTFLGQASGGKNLRGFSQKEQLEVVRKFRVGGFNTLVSTCVGEEGLDIGEVDLIVCFDAQKSPIRLVQRMGRTGRRRQGRIVVILAEGREERTYNQSQSNRRSVNKCIAGKKHNFIMYPHSPRMLPADVTPTVHKMHITCGQFEPKDYSRRSVKGRRSLPTGRVPLLHPLGQAGGVEECLKDDGFLSPAEQAVWASTMKLREWEPQPTLRTTSFLSLGADPQPQDASAQSLVRPLSLWEWRHWQNQPLPTHRVEHSARCLHFTAIMELIDRMKQEEEQGTCRYESELMAYLNEGDVISCKEDGRMENPTSGKAHRQKRPKITPAAQDNVLPISAAKLNKIDAALQEERSRSAGDSSSCTVIKDVLPPETDHYITKGQDDLGVFQDNFDDPVANMNVDEGTLTGICEYSEVKPSVQEEQIHSSLGHPQDPCNSQSDGSADELFYLPKWDVLKCPKLHPLKQSTSLKLVLSSVKCFLSRSPPSSSDLNCSLTSNEPNQSVEICSGPKEGIDQFQVNFCLEVDENPVNGDSVDANVSGEHSESPDTPETLQPAVGPGNAPSPAPASSDRSPSWEEVFEDDLDNTEADKEPALPSGPKKQLELTSLDASVDLFGDDEAFLQISLPDIATPNKGTITPMSRQDIEQEGQIIRHVGQIASSSFNAGESHKSNKTPCPLLLEQKRVSEHKSEAFDYSQDIFSVNFDLGFSFESDEENAECVPVPSTVAKREQTFTSPTLAKPSEHSNIIPLGHVSTPRVCPVNTTKLPSLMDKTYLSPIVTEGQNMVTRPNTFTPSSVLFSPNCTSIDRPSKSWSFQAQSRGIVNRSFRRSLLQTEKTTHQDSVSQPLNSDSEEEIVIKKRCNQEKVNPLASPEHSKIFSDVDSPVQVPRRRVARLNVSESDGGAVSDDDFQKVSFCQPKVPQPCKHTHLMKKSKAEHREGRQFLDEEAVLSDGDSFSSDECEGEELNQSLEGFVVDNTHVSQGLNDSEMREFYLKSVKSPAISNKFRMVYKPIHNMDIFSQVPEQDETYAEDSFVVEGSGDEDGEDAAAAEEEEEEVGAEILPEDSYVDGRRQYPTRRRARLRQSRDAGETRGVRVKRSRIIPVRDSSDEEEESKRLHAEAGPVSERPAARVSQHRMPECGPSRLCTEVHATERPGREEEERTQQMMKKRAQLSDELDFQLPLPSCLAEAHVAGGGGAGGAAVAERPPARLGVLMDSRCLSSSVEVVSALRLKHGLAVQVCSLASCDLVVSRRMAVEWQNASELASPQSRRRLQERLQSLQGLFDRVCLLVEKDRTKPGEPLRSFHRSRYYDSTVAALVRAGIRLLFSSGPDDTAALLAQLAQVEQRKGWAIGVPMDVKGHQQQALQFYLTLPCVSYVSALYMCHSFSSVSQLVNSSLEGLQRGIQVSRSRAEEIYRCLRYPCDTALLKTSTSKSSL
ncbi:Fanconi anemia group M protein isoform X3 [Brachyhypopomus gauderio]|uniref:Fanconi anemia group M protein isoform X3 n=1 Tax=Brachyhypopomus gauderio TaxID=698409 RepID=UPI004041D5AF